MKKIIVIVLLVALAVGGYLYYQHTQQAQSDNGIVKTNGRLELNRLDIAGLYAGKVNEIYVNEGDWVKKDQILTALSSDTANAQLLAAKAQKQQAQEAVDRAAAQVESYIQQQRVAQLDVDNGLSLRKDNLISNSELTKRRAALDSAKAAVQSAQAAQSEAKAAVEAAQAQIDQASSVSDDMAIRAPIDGFVQYRFVELGNVIAAGHPAVSLLDPTDVSMNIFLTLPQIANLKVGDEARIVLDGIDAVFPATINYIAENNQFTPKTVETQEERTKFVFKVKLKLPVETAEKYRGLLKGGLTGNAYVRVENRDWPADLAVKLP